jgi:GDP-L-fucose synthase
MSLKNKKIYLAGHKGMVGSAILRRFNKEGYFNINLRELPELDLTRQESVEDFFSSARPEIVIIAAAKVGGIMANNTYRADFIYENLMIECNLIHTAFEHNVEKLILLGSSSIYPRSAPQPLKEEYLLSGYLEETNEPYSIAKIAGIKLCENYYRQYGCNFYCIMPANMYGPNDHYDPEKSHVIPGLIRKFHDAAVKNKPSVVLWGTGTPMREFLYVEDLAEAITFLMENTDAEHIYSKGISHLNIGSGKDITIKELADITAEITGFKGSIEFDTSRPDGVPRKLLDSSRMEQLGWTSKTELKEGIGKAYKWFRENYKL